jgi:putative SOS response-associated peptidase YedK
MANRLVFFLSEEEIEAFYGVISGNKNLYEPHYNISPGYHMTVITDSESGIEMKRLRWGSEKSRSTIIHVDEASEELKVKNLTPCVVPLSGFYVWKDNVEKGFPFFVRMMDGPVMSVAGLIDKDESFRIITTKSNVLVQPMTETMPMLLDRALSFSWLDKGTNSVEILKTASKRFLLTDLSVMRVNKKVNDPKNNDVKLIQPIPK